MRYCGDALLRRRVTALGAMPLASRLNPEGVSVKINLQEIPEEPELDATEDLTDLMWTDLDLYTLLGEGRKEFALQADDRMAA